MNKQLSCPVCDGTDKLKKIKGIQKIPVRGDIISVEAEYYKCAGCGEKFLVPALQNDPFEKAYRLYRQKNRMLQPEEIRDFRRRYNITQGELANLLGLGGATISRYETGKIQDESHDTLLRLALDPENLYKLVSGSSGIFTDEKKRKILAAIRESAEQGNNMLEQFVIMNFQDYAADEYSGFKKFDRDKFRNAFLYFCAGAGEFKTKLNKLLFYSDFQHFKEYTNSITGAQYAHIPFGPAPNNFDLYYSVLIHRGVIGVEEVEYRNSKSAKYGFTGERYMAKERPDLNVFSASELRVLALIKENFKDFSASEISDLSHKERAYLDTIDGKVISYTYARYLKLIHGVKP
jgi:putative zinc finger/helix-turn-helix YgiT family protein